MPMTARRLPPPRRIVFTILVLGLVGSLCGAAYTAYRVDRFSRSVFRTEPLPTTGLAAITEATVAAIPTPRVGPDTGTTTVTASAQTTQPTMLPTPTLLPFGAAEITERLQAGQRFTVLLLGFSGPGHNGAYLTDSVQVVSFAPATDTITLISVPRDLWVELPGVEGRGGTWGKINQAYRLGMGQVGQDASRVPYAIHAKGGQVASQVTEELLGLSIDAWVSLDFAGFVQAIDALGGVDVHVERGFTDTRYPANDDVSMDAGYTTIQFKAGCELMDGARALTFARSRYAPRDGTDFGRAKRQQRLLGAVQQKAFRVATIPKVFALLSALEGHLYTSLSRAEAQDLAGWLQAQARKQRPIHIVGGGLDAANLLVESRSPQGAYVLAPRLGNGNYRAIRHYVRTLLAPPASPTPQADPKPTTPINRAMPTRSSPSATPTLVRSCQR